MDRLEMPEAMPAEDAERLSDVADSSPALDVTDEGDLRQVVGAELVEPLSQLFSTRDQISQLQRSDAFNGSVNHQRAVEWLLRDLHELEEALRRRWEAS